jgi:hypothetical protein
MAVSLPVSMHVNLVAHRMVMVVGMRRHHDAEGGERRGAGKDRFLHHIFLCSDGWQNLLTSTIRAANV